MEIQRYDALYLKDFFAPAEVEEDIAPAEEENAAPEEPVFFSEEQLAHARDEGKKEGMAMGYEQGYAEAKAEQAKREDEVALAIKSVAATMEGMQAAYQLEMERQRDDIGELALMMAKKVADASLHKNAVPMMEAMLERCMPMMMQKPHLTIELHPDILEQAHMHLQVVIERAGFEGSTQVQPNNTLAIHDIRIDWQSGAATRKTAELWQEMDAIIARLNTPNTTPNLQEN